MSDQHDRYENYTDDDTITVGCHYCRWESGGHQDETAADRRAFERHVLDAAALERDSRSVATDLAHSLEDDMDVKEAQAFIERAVENPTANVQTEDLAVAIATVIVRSGLLGLALSTETLTVVPLSEYDALNKEAVRLYAAAWHVFDAAGQGEDALADALVALGLVLAGEKP